MMNLKPTYTSLGDSLGIVAPARSIDIKKIDFAEQIFHSWGLNTIKGKNLLGKHYQYSGTDKERYEDMQEMLNHPEINAIICAGGGYGTVRFIAELNFEGLKKHPKWLVGFSDITILHAAVYRKTGMETIHGPMPVKFDDSPESEKSLKTLKNALFGHLEEYHIAAFGENVKGSTEGVLIGGNLSILTSLLGTPFDLNYKDKILFIEEIDEYLYHIDRMMYSLKIAGKLKQINGIIVGNFSKVHDNDIPFGKDEKQIILDLVKEYDYPVMFDFPAGHEDLNQALYLGRKVLLDVKDQESVVKFK